MDVLTVKGTIFHISLWALNNFWHFGTFLGHQHPNPNYDT